MKNAAPAFFVPRWDSAGRAGEGLDLQIPFAGADQADGLDIPPDAWSNLSMNSSRTGRRAALSCLTRRTKYRFG